MLHQLQKVSLQEISLLFSAVLSGSIVVRYGIYDIYSRETKNTYYWCEGREVGKNMQKDKGEVSETLWRILFGPWIGWMNEGCARVCSRARCSPLATAKN
jgi:hypothetical protein